MITDTYANHGGAANHLGVTYQDRVSAWLCVQILAEQESSPILEWLADSTLDFIRCETEHLVESLKLTDVEKYYECVLMYRTSVTPKPG